MLGRHDEGPPDVASLHADGPDQEGTLRSRKIDLRLPVTEDVHVRRRVVVDEDHEPQAVGPVDRDHAPSITDRVGFFNGSAHARAFSRFSFFMRAVIIVRFTGER